VADNTASPVGLRIIRGRAPADRVNEALALTQLEGYGNRRINQLSGGQQQRVALARALVYRPPLLLMDEPLGALDKKLREDLQLEIKRLQRKLGTTVIYVTHDQSEALTMADRIAVMRDGRVQQYASPREIYETPANAFIAGFIGETNFLGGTLEGGPGAWRFRLTESEWVIPVAAAPSGCAAGTAADIAIRPEFISLAPVGDCALAGTVEEVIYGGGTVACFVRVSPRATVTLRLPSGTASSPSVGETIGLRLPEEHTRVFVS
jgi:putative spermidine/putrescine transport system ATP-binding protein/mannopine transport system ATP-binding protein